MLAEICQYTEQDLMLGDNVVSNKLQYSKTSHKVQVRQRWTACEDVAKSEQGADVVTRMEEGGGVIDSAASEGLGPVPNCKPKLARSGSNCLVPA
jgi:hypothetical protein